MNQTSNKIAFASLLSIIGNLALSVIKIVAGLISGSIAVLSDGIDSAADVVISIVMYFTARIMNKPPNDRYVYGYYKAEGVATKILSFVIFYAGAQMFIASIKDMANPTVKVLPDRIAIYVTVISILIKLLLSIHQTRAGKKLNSSMLLANGVNMRNDIITSISVLLGLVFTFVFDMPIFDSITALLVSLFIIRSAVGIFKDSSLELMDGIKDVDIYNKIFTAVSQVQGVHNPHKVRSRLIGNRYAIDLDIEVDDCLTVREAHNLANQVEEKIREAIPEVYDIVIRVEPIGSCRKTEAYGIDSLSNNTTAKK